MKYALIAAALLAGCSFIQPNSEAPNLTRFTAICELREVAIDGWTDALEARVPTRAAAVRADDLIQKTDDCEDPELPAKFAAADDADAAAVRQMLGNAASLVGFIATELLASEQFGDVGREISADLFGLIAEAK